MKGQRQKRRHRLGGPAGWVVLVVLAIGTLGPGCNGPATTWDDPGPTTVFERYLMHWFKNEQKQAFEMIRPEDREALTESLEFVDGKVDSEVLEPHEMLVAGRVDNPYDLKDIEVEPKLESKPESGQQVTLTLVYHDGRSGRATMVWDGDRWLVDLPLEATDGEESASDESGGDPPAEETATDEDQPDPSRPSGEPSDAPDVDSGDSRE